MKYIKYVLFIASIGFVSGCTEDFEELNTNPNALIASDVNVSLLGQGFANAQYNTVNGLNWRFQISENLFSDLYCQYFATTAANFDSDRYVEVGRWIDLAWSSFYGQAAPAIKFVEDFTKENNLPEEGAVNAIWKVYGYQRVTELLGPVIYSEFGNGETSVAYDTQEEMYRSFFPTLDAAVAILKSSSKTNVFGTNDQIFSGDVTKWIKFANSLRLRLAMRVKYVDPALAKVEAEKAVAGGLLESNADNAYMLTTLNSMNPFTTITNWGEFRMSALMESVLEGYGDPRISLYFSPAAAGDTDGDGSPYEGLRNGQAKVDKVPALNSNNSDLGQIWLPPNKGGTNPPILVMTAAESFFLRAEGALEGWNMGGSAKSLYEQGIRLSMQDRVKAPDDAINAYIASKNIPTAADPNSPPTTNIPVAFEESGSKERQLEQIITQKWIALYPDGWEAFAEVRRTGYPKLYPVLFSENADLAPTDVFRRMTFVDGEFNNNKAAVEAAAQLPELNSRGGDKNSTKLWWDAKQ
ncbi:MAG: SusD/RagB family nutrient-binding outer membrane lipoprotein [Saprospiraceae bacterium]|nr:SusD/RagB family nutrient-binding outer membrane lipoprotein [Saprospiraceae bacterium]